MTAPTVRPLRAPEDVPALASLISALADYEKLDPPTAEAKARLAADAGKTPPRFHAFLAERDGKPIGYAVYFFTYSTFLAQPSLYLEDLFVLPSEREHGAGGALFQRLAEEAVAQGCGRMEWSVLDWNQLAHDFYARRSATRMNQWVWYRLEGEALKAAALPRGSK